MERTKNETYSDGVRNGWNGSIDAIDRFIDSLDWYRDPTSNRDIIKTYLRGLKDLK